MVEYWNNGKNRRFEGGTSESLPAEAERLLSAKAGFDYCRKCNLPAKAPKLPLADY